MTPKMQGFMWGVAFGVAAMYFYTRSSTGATATR